MVASLKSFFEYHYEYIGFYIPNMCFNQFLASISFFSQDFIMKNFKYKDNLEKFYNEHLYIHLQDSTVNILVFLLCHMFLSNNSYIDPLILIILLIIFEVCCRHWYTSPSILHCGYY